jgi:hypothetical protein
MFLDKSINEETMKRFIKEFPMGIQNEKQMLSLYQIQNLKFYENSQFFSNQIHQLKKTNKQIFEQFKPIVENLKICLIPTRYLNRIIFDATGKYNGYLLPENLLNNVQHNFSFQKDIVNLGGINPILPFLEALCIFSQ